MRKNPTKFRKKYLLWKSGVSVNDLFGADAQDPDYLLFKSTLPDNQRLTPEDEYSTHRYWELNGKPKNFNEAVKRGMYEFNKNDNLFHAGSIALRPDGDYEFMKPKTHPTVGYETSEYYTNSEFNNRYKLVDDPNRPNFYKYEKRWNLPAYDDGYSPETYNAGYLPSVTIEAQAPYAYQDQFTGLWYGIGYGGKKTTKGPGFDPSGARVVTDPKMFDDLRLLQYLKDDPLRTEAFKDQTRELVTQLVTAPMFDVAAEPVGALINRAVKPVQNYAKAYKISKAIDNGVKSTTPSVDEFNKLWYLNELTFEGPVEVRKFSQTPKVGDFIDYGFNQGALKGVSRETPLSELTKYLKEVVQKLYTNPATHGDWFPSYSGAKGSKLIHQNETGALPTSATGFIPKDATNSNSPWITSIHGEKPAIWYNRNKPYYNAQGYPSYLDIPETLVTNLKAAEQLGLTFDGTLGKEVSKVLSAPEELPFEAVEYGIRPNMFGFFDRIKYSKALRIPDNNVTNVIKPTTPIPFWKNTKNN